MRIGKHRPVIVLYVNYLNGNYAKLNWTLAKLLARQ
jgi:hypothetical protein